MGAEQVQAVSSHKYTPDERIAGTPYRVVGLIGVGGMGSVYEVEHEVLGRRFVFKLLHDRLAARSDLVARMQNEWRALAGLKHPNIVQVTDAGFTRESLPFYVMERLEGQTVAALIRAQKRVDLRIAGRILLDVLAGLEAAHRVYVVHRDIKPQNLFRTTDGTTKLLDFGIAKLQEKSKRVVTQAGVALGTPRYMAPEQAEGKPVDGRADIYACGLVLYELLSGVSPFHHWKEPTEVVLAQIHEEPLRLDAIRDDISPVVSDLVQRWLSKSPDSRPLSAEIARRELAAVMGVAKDARSATLSDVTSVGAYDAETLGPVASPGAPRSALDSTRPPSSDVRPSRGTSPDPTETFVDPVAPAAEPTTTGEPYPDEPTRPLFVEGAEAAYRGADEVAREATARPAGAYLVRDSAVLRFASEPSWLPREWRALALAFAGAFSIAAVGAFVFAPRGGASGEPSPPAQGPLAAATSSPVGTELADSQPPIPSPEPPRAEEPAPEAPEAPQAASSQVPEVTDILSKSTPPKAGSSTKEPRPLGSDRPPVPVKSAARTASAVSSPAVAPSGRTAVASRPKTPVVDSGL